MLVVIRKMHTNRVAPMVERGYREGTKFQWVRETTINAIEAGATKIEFGVEWQAVKSSNFSGSPLCSTTQFHTSAWGSGFGWPGKCFHRCVAGTIRVLAATGA